MNTSKELLLELSEIVPVKARLDLAFWLYFFRFKNPNSVLIMNVQSGDYFIVNKE